MNSCYKLLVNLRLHSDSTAACSALTVADRFTPAFIGLFGALDSPVWVMLLGDRYYWEKKGLELRGTCGHCQQAKTSDLYVPHTSRPGLSDSDSDSSTVTSLHFHPTPVIIFLLLYHSAPCFSYPLPFNARGYLSLFVLRVSATNKVFHRAKSTSLPLSLARGTFSHL
ncbi:hypothetical protein HZ326_3261 [Fusarium oxysporum f. sp. albedinis]|nr:hypothetical protein HZ326_3261 [Fusarium oxysporum f. sp. albedinis]